jgi:hypothetical protein
MERGESGNSRIFRFSVDNFVGIVRAATGTKAFVDGGMVFFAAGPERPFFINQWLVGALPDFGQ